MHSIWPVWVTYATIGDSAADREPDHVIIDYRQLSSLKKIH